MKRFETRKRTALDGSAWWCVYDNERHAWSTVLCHGRYKTRKAAQYAIDKNLAFCAVLMGLSLKPMSMPKTANNLKREKKR